MRKLRREELAQQNGKNDGPAYVAYEGRVYDVSASFLWKGGSHQVSHHAGQDLTEAMAQAPHGKEMLDRFPVVGALVDD